MVDPEYVARCAQYYAGRLNWPIFPLHPIRPDGRCGCGRRDCAVPGKHPIPSHWERSIASFEAAASAWQTRFGVRGIGLVCGPKSGVWALDVDPHTGGLDTLSDLQRTHGTLPRTWTGRTGSGGRHYFFRAVDEQVRNSASQVAPGLDVRGVGGYVVLPPSPHSSGHEYEWIDPPHKTDLADAPQWLAVLAAIRPRKPGHRRNGRDESLKLIAAGKRHDALVRFCGLLRSCGLGEDAIVECGFALLRHHAAADPPMDLKQAERDMRDVARRYPPTVPGAK